ncbi:MAG: CvpA family protein, partial [Bacteroidota bacterium]|nr:CvpA family protein [Bacteroidota bacterium]
FDWSPLAVQTGSYLMIFIIIFYGLSVLAKTLTKIISKASLGLLNKFLGAFFGVLKWAILMSVALFFLGKLNTWVTIIDAEMIENSILYEPITELGEYLFSWGSDLSKELPDDLI